MDRKEKKKKLITNTAYLLNSWFPEDSTLWKEVRRFISDAHNNHLGKKGSCFVEVTFRLIKEPVQKEKERLLKINQTAKDEVRKRIWGH